MGIRIRKVLGYGLNDLNTKVVDKWGTEEVDDPRFDPSGWWHADCATRAKKWSTEGFLKHCQQVIDDSGDDNYNHFELRLMLSPSFENVRMTDIDHCVSHDNEGGLAHVVTFTPFTSPNWVRYDDTIDYYDSGIGVEPNIKLLDVPLFPHVSYIDNTTGERANRDVEHAIYLFRNAPNQNGEELNYIQLKALENIRCKEHWTERYNVAIPDELVEFFRYANMFVDEKTIWQLKPMIYTYWA